MSATQAEIGPITGCTKYAPVSVFLQYYILVNKGPKEQISVFFFHIHERYGLVLVVDLKTIHFIETC